MEEVQHRVFSDIGGKPLAGSINYKFHLPPGIPAGKFWSIIVYDNHTQLMIRTDQSWPSVHSQCKNLVFNQDGSVDVWFGAMAPPGKETNWIQTIPGKRWHMILRLYQPTESWFNRQWKPGDIEEVT